MAGDLQRKGYVGKTIGIKLRYDDFRIATRDQTIDHFTADAKTIRQVAGQCLKRVPLERRLRLLGVRVGKLAKAGSPEAQAAPAAAHRARSRHRAAEPPHRSRARWTCSEAGCGAPRAAHAMTISSWWFAMCRLCASAKSGLVKAP